MVSAILPFIVLLSVYSLSASSSCQKKAYDHVLNISFDYLESDMASALSGVEKDSASLISINKKLYPKATVSNFTDSNFINKDNFLVSLKNLSKKSKKNKSIALNYSGHGVRCQYPDDDKIHWCLLLPTKGTKAYDLNNKYDDKLHSSIFIIDEKSEDHLVTDIELLEAYPAQAAIIDSCHSGQIDLEWKKQIGKNKGTFLFASALGQTVALDDPDTGGKLVGRLKNMVTENSKEICKLDLDGDGNISQREAGFALFFSSIKWAERKGKDFRPYLSKNAPQVHLIEGSDQCLFSTPENICQRPFSKESSKCESSNQKYKYFKNSVASLIKDKEPFSFLDKKENEDKEKLCYQISTGITPEQYSNCSQGYIKIKYSRYTRGVNTGITKCLLKSSSQKCTGIPCYCKDGYVMEDGRQDSAPNTTDTLAKKQQEYAISFLYQWEEDFTEQRERACNSCPHRTLGEEQVSIFSNIIDYCTDESNNIFKNIEN